MEFNQIRQSLSQVDQVIARATQALKDDQAAPQELKDYVKKLSNQSRQAQETLRQSQDEETVLECIDDLEETSDRAKRVSDKTSALGVQAKIAVQEAHQQLSDLKHQLH